eukprot:6195287-Pleurochrysis_carterae.AAC.2
MAYAVSSRARHPEAPSTLKPHFRYRRSFQARSRIEENFKKSEGALAVLGATLLYQCCHQSCTHDGGYSAHELPVALQ